MPAGIPVATVALDGARNAGILATQILAINDESLLKKLLIFKEDLKIKVVNANKELSKVTYKFKV